MSGGLELGADPAAHVASSRAFFEDVSGSASNGTAWAAPQGSGMFLLAVFALNVWLIQRGLSRGIERFCSWAMRVMAVCALAVLVRVLTLGAPDPAHPKRSVLAALGFFWNPDASRLADLGTRMAAAGQVFFSLSLGFGVILNYASYVRHDEDIVLGSLTASATNEVFEVGFGGMITVTAAFLFLGASGVVGGTFGVGFQALPVVFHQMGDWGPAVGAVWFLMLFLAAITRSLSMLHPVKAFVQEALGLSAGRSVLCVALLDRRAPYAGALHRIRRPDCRRKAAVTSGGWAFMTTSLVLVWAVAVWCFVRVARRRPPESASGQGHVGDDLAGSQPGAHPYAQLVENDQRDRQG